MSCLACYIAYDDYVEERKAHRVCKRPACGCTLCKECSNKVTSCPRCRTPIIEREFVRYNTEKPEEIKQEKKKVVFVLDTSGSMEELSGKEADSPTRLELAVHILKNKKKMCQKLGLPFVVYVFSDTVRKLDNTNDDSLEKLRPNGCTYVGPTLKKIRQDNPENDITVFLLTDGQPTDETYGPELKLFDGIKFNLIAFSSDVSVDLLELVATSSLHTISYVEDIRSLAAYLVPVFIYSVLDCATVELSTEDEKLREKFVEILGPQIRGKTDKYNLQDLANLLSDRKTTYAKDLLIDTKGDKDHSRIEKSFLRENWNVFGKFYLQCIYHCHKYKIPGNTFDPSLHHYRHERYKQIFDLIQDIPASVKFVSFLAKKEERAYASQQATQYVLKSYSSMDRGVSSDNDGCISPDSIVSLLSGPRRMDELVPGDVLSSGIPVKWIVRISNLGGSGNVTLYNGFTPSHPVLQDGKWILAKDTVGAKVEKFSGIVYDLAFENGQSAIVNGIESAVLGFPVPGMVHPYYGTRLVLDDLQRMCPEGGFVNVDARKFQYRNGLVSSIF